MLGYSSGGGEFFESSQVDVREKSRHDLWVLLGRDRDDVGI
jgi:hypothetical protein